MKSLQSTAEQTASGLPSTSSALVSHTPTPWTSTQYDTQVIVYGPRKIQVMATSWHGSMRSSYPLKPESLANAAFVLKAVNNHDSLVEKLGKIVKWLERLAVAAESGAQNCSYESLREGYIADAKNYRKTMADILPVLEAAQSGVAAEGTRKP